MARDFDGALKPLRDARTAPRVPSGKAHITSVETQLEAIARGDFAAAVANARDDVQLEILAPPEFPFIRRAAGKTELLHAMKTNFESIENQQPEISNVVTEGDTVVLIGRERGIIRSSRAAYDIEFVHRLTFQEGKLAAIRIIAAKTERA